jgi:uncharacterized protein YeaO (DUF488 family)
MIKIKRIYETPNPGDGHRVLVDRLWPRGIGKKDARLDEWLREIAPSTALRRWFNHDPARWPQFVKRYRQELKSPASATHLARLRRLSRTQTVTILYGAREERYNNAVALAGFLKRRST